MYCALYKVIVVLTCPNLPRCDIQQEPMKKVVLNLVEFVPIFNITSKMDHYEVPPATLINAAMVESTKTLAAVSGIVGETYKKLSVNDPLNVEAVM